MKLPKVLAKLRATATRRPLRTSTQANYDDMSEPNMKLSRALLVVLLLHVVAVSGIVAFNAIKTRQTAVASSAGATKAPATSQSSPVAASPAASVSKTEHVKKVEPVRSSTESHKIYVVAKGDNPVTIAKKFKVSYDDLIALNHIEDPRKLRVGQKLLIPTKTTKAKKTTE